MIARAIRKFYYRCFYSVVLPSNIVSEFFPSNYQVTNRIVSMIDVDAVKEPFLKKIRKRSPMLFQVLQILISNWFFKIVKKFSNVQNSFLRS